MTIRVIPTTIDPDEFAIASRCLIHIRASDHTLTALGGQVPTFSRAATASLVDSNGTSFTAPQHMVAWEPMDWDNDGSESREAMAVRLGNSDRLSYACPWRPMALAFHHEFIQVGSMPTAGVALWSITNDAVSGARLICSSSGTSGFWQIVHHNGSTSQTRTLAVAPTDGQRVELWGYLYEDGAVQLWQSINKAAATNTTRSSANALASAWGTGAVLRIGASGTGNYASQRLRRFRLAPSLPDYATLLRTL